MDSSSSSAQPQQRQQQQQQPTGGSSGGPQVRSRITVVCAECKRLKLKCDRKTPCGSCEKRDTVARCIYSPAAAEKVDLHSLNNRLTAVEAQLSQMGPGSSRSCNHHGGSGLGLPPNDRALIAVGHSGSSLTIPVEDVTAIWLDQLDLNKDLPALIPSNTSLSPSFTAQSLSQIKLEPNSNPLYSENANVTSDLPAALLLPPPSIYYPPHSPRHQPSVTTELVALLPSCPSKRRKLCNSVEEILTIKPCFVWKHFKERLDGMFRWAADTEAIERAAFESGRSSPRSKVDTARAIFFGEPVPGKTTEPKPTISFFAAVAGALAVGAQACRDNGATDDNAMAVDDILSNVRALSRQTSSVSSTQGKKARTTSGMKPSPSFNRNSRSSGCPTLLFALSEQALDIFEKSSTYDLDYLIALIMQALYMLHDGKPVVDHRLYPLVGKMVNVARMMGLGVDPDDFPGKYSLFEAETRRRIWWDIYCYDLYVSDSMGHPPTISDNSFTTKMPVDVDENLFSPSSTSVPVPNADDHASKYFGLKLRMAQIVKSVKKRTFRDPLTDSPLSDLALMEEAASFEGEVVQFLIDLPPAFKLDIDADLSAFSAASSPSYGLSADSPGRSSSSARLVAQQCELVITGQRLILKIYLPFLRPNHSGSTYNTSHNQAAVGTINAAHAIIYASRVLHSICKQPPGAQSKRPGPAIFDYYSFGQALFDAAVVCAYSVIIQPTSIWARVALDDIVDALEVMKDPAVATGRGTIQAGVEGCVSEPVKVIEMLKRKADSARAGNSSSVGSNSGSKRKHSEVTTDADRLGAGFQLPYVGAGVASAGLAVGSPGPSVPASSPADGTQSESGANGSEANGMQRPDKEKMKSKKEKKTSYPMIGVRVRPGKEAPPFMRRRERAHSTTSTSSLVEPDALMQPPASLSSNQSVLRIATPVPTGHHSFTMPVTQESSSTYQPSTSSDSTQPPMQPELIMPHPHTEYSSQFPGSDNGNLHVNMPPRHKFVHEVGGYSTGTPSQLSMYDQNQSNPFTNASSPTSFRPSSSGQLSNGNSSFGGPIGMSSQVPSTPFAPPHDSGMQSYKPSNSPSNYFIPQSYQSNGPQGGMLGLNMPSGMSIDNTGDTNGSSNDAIFDVEPQNGNGLRQSFVDIQRQGHGWQRENGDSGNGVQFWQPDYKPYFTT